MVAENVGPRLHAAAACRAKLVRAKNMFNIGCARAAVGKRRPVFAHAEIVRFVAADVDDRPVETVQDVRPHSLDEAPRIGVATIEGEPAQALRPVHVRPIVRGFDLREVPVAWH